MVPRLAGSSSVPEIVQMRCDPLRSESLIHIFIIYDTDNGSLLFIDRQHKNLMLALVEASAFYKVVTVRGKALLKAPALDPVSRKPLCNERRFIRNSSDPVKHENQQYVKLFLQGKLFDDLELVAVFCPHLMAGNAFLLLFVDDYPIFLLAELMAGFSLHGHIGLIFVVVIHLLVGGNTV